MTAGEPDHVISPASPRARSSSARSHKTSLTSHKPQATSHKPQETNTSSNAHARPPPSLPSHNPPPRRDSDIWAIYSRLCIHDMLDHMENATNARDPDIESLNPGYAQPAYR